ncbi:MAG TPA: hypothetical protein VNL69_01995 [Bacteroidota bacterium]|nr:hypothetical protein [Bacteroidota bacterium]
MRQIARIAGVSMLLFGTLCAQEASPGTTLAGDARLNFAVPDAPAFTILNYSPTNIVRPSTVQEVALAIADFAESGGVLPRTAAAEFSPGLLIGGRTLTIRQYNANPFWYRARISAATRSFDDNTGRVHASIGLRFTFTDEADPRTDRAFIENLSNLALQINQAVARRVQVAPPTETGRIEGEGPAIDALEREVEALREKQREEKWNANIAEFAAAVRFASPDSLAKNARADKYQAWLAGAFSVSTWGQFVFNLSGSIERSPSLHMDSTSIAMASRFYLGTNSLKVFGEGQLTAVSESPAIYFLNIGGELNPISSFWLEFAVGIEKQGREPAIIRTAFHVRWSLPELML